MRRFIFAVILWLAGASFAQGYTYIQFSNGAIGSLNPGSTTMLIRVPSSATFEDGTTYATSVRQAMLDWNAQLGRMQFLPVIEAPGTGDGENSAIEVFFSNTIYGGAFGPSTLAVTVTNGYSRANGSVALYGNDVIFNTAYTWSSYRGPLRVGIQDIRRVAIHEFGHVLGLDHPDEAGQTGIAAIMNSYVSNLDGLQTDDINGGRSLYGAPGSVTPPSNDLFANAIPITLTARTQTFSGSNVNAFKEAGEPYHAPNEPGGSSVWWKWAAPVNGTLKVTTRNSTFDTMLSAYTGSVVHSLNQIATNDDEQAPGSVPEPTRIRTSIVTINVVAGTTYYFAVDGWASEQGAIYLNLELTSRPVITNPPNNQSVLVGDSVTFSVGAFGNTPLAYQWRKNGVAIPGAISASYTIASASVDHGGDYDVVVTNSLGSSVSSVATLQVAKHTQSLSFSMPSSIIHTADPLTLVASATSGLPVSFTVVSGPALVQGDQLIFTGVGPVTVRAEQSGNATYQAATPIERTINVFATFDYWRHTQFTEQQLAIASISGPDADPDGDGYANLIEYALGAEPFHAESVALTELAVEGDSFIFSYRRPSNRGDIIYSVEVSGDLVNWSADGVSHVLSHVEGEWEHWTATHASGGGLFFRLVITRN